MSIFGLWKEIPDLPIDSKKEETTETATASYPTITDPAWIEENMKKVTKNSNL